MNEFEFGVFAILVNELLTFNSDVEPFVEDNLSVELVDPPSALNVAINGTGEPFFDNLFFLSSNARNPSAAATLLPFFGPVLPPQMETSLRFTELPLDDIPNPSNNGRGVHFLAGQSHASAQGRDLIIHNSAKVGARRYVIV